MAAVSDAKKMRSKGEGYTDGYENVTVGCCCLLVKCAAAAAAGLELYVDRTSRVSSLLSFTSGNAGHGNGAPNSR